MGQKGIKIETLSGVKTADILMNDGEESVIKIHMGKEELNPKRIPMIFDKEKVVNEPITVNSESIEECLNKLDNLFARDTLFIEKQTKNKKQEQVDIKEFLISSKNEIISFCNIRTTIHCFAGSEKNLNPNLVIELIQNELGEDMEDFEIHRKGLII